MAALQEGSPSSPPSALQEGEGSPLTPCGCRRPTPPTAPPRMAAPKKARSKMVKLVLDSVDELYEKCMEENRKRENSEEALEALRKKKVRILMSMR